MGTYEARIFPSAQRDLEEIVDCLNTLSPEVAIKYYDLIVEQIGSLSELPERCPLTRDTQLRLRGYRTLPVKNYLVFYLVKDSTVGIRRILYAKRQYETML